MNQTVYFQQGDELFHEINKLPSPRKKRTSGVIIKSPVTGHSHKLVEGDLLVSNGELFVRGPARIVHQEHKDVVLPKGFYLVKSVQEYDHMTEESRNVID